MIGINSVDLVFFILFLGGFVVVELCVCCSVFVLFVWFWCFVRGVLFGRFCCCLVCCLLWLV